MTKTEILIRLMFNGSQKKWDKFQKESDHPVNVDSCFTFESYEEWEAAAKKLKAESVRQAQGQRMTKSGQRRPKYYGPASYLAIQSDARGSWSIGSFETKHNCGYLNTDWIS